MATIALSGSAIIQAGTAVGSVPGNTWDDWIDQAEAYLCNLVKYDIVSNWASLNATYKLIFEEYAERYAAMCAILYDMSGYTTRIEAEDMINVHWARMQIIRELLKDASVEDFLGV